MTAASPAFGQASEAVRSDWRTGPREGWSSLALLLFLLLVVGLAVDDANWAGFDPDGGHQTGFLPLAMVLAGIVGFALAKTRLPAFLVHLTGAVIGAGYLLVAAGNAISDAPGIPGRLRALNESVVIFYDDAVVQGIRSAETSVFLLTLGTLLWAVGQFGAFNLFRRGRATPALVSAGLALLINMSITIRVQYLHLIVFAAAAMLLMVRLNLLVQSEGWRRRRIRDAGDAAGLFLQGGLAFIALTLAGAVVLAATASSAPLANAWRDMDDTLLTVGTEVNRWLGGVTGAARGPSGLFSASQTITGVWESSQEAVFRSRASDGGAYYWRGATYDRFDGFTWQQLERVRTTVPAGRELLAGTADAVTEETGTRRVDLTVTSISLAGGTLLAPETPLLVDRETEVVTHDEGGPMVAIDLRDAIDPGQWYTVASRVAESRPEEGGVTAADLAAAGVEYPAWARRFVEVHPGSIGPLVEETASRIVRGMPPSRRDPYHVAEAIQRYLYQDGGFEYRTDVRGLCGREKVVDCFLRTKVGYCEHFATTMVMLLRTQLIPARLAMGYLPGKPLADGSWEIDRSAAHAWVEVYFPGYGWFRFDPTPGNTENGQAPTVLAAGSPGDQGPGGAGPGATPNFDVPDARRPVSLDDDDDLGTLEPVIAPPSADPGPLAAIVVAVVAAILGVLALLARTRRIGYPEPDLAYRGVARLAARFGHGPKPTETAYEYAGSLGELVPSVRSELQVVARAKVESTYARRRPTDEMLAQLRTAYRRVRVGLLRLVFRRRPKGHRVR